MSIVSIQKGLRRTEHACLYQYTIACARYEISEAKREVPYVPTNLLSLRHFTHYVGLAGGSLRSAREHAKAIGAGQLIQEIDSLKGTLDELVEEAFGSISTRFDTFSTQMATNTDPAEIVKAREGLGYALESAKVFADKMGFKLPAPMQKAYAVVVAK